MPSIEAIRRIRIEQVSTGGEAVRRDLQATANAQEQIGAAAEAAAIISESAARRQLSGATAYQRLREQVDQAARSATAYQKALNTIDRASTQGVAGAADLARTLSLVENRYGAAAVQARAFEEASRRAAAAQREAWQGVSTQGARQLQNVEASRRLGSLGAPDASSRAANENRRLRSDQVQNLLYQGSDIVSSLGSGMNPGTVLLQQGGQIGQVFAGPGGASIKGAFSQAGEAATGLATRIGVVGGAFGVLTAAAAAAVAAEQSYASTQMALAQQLSGAGRAAGVTASQINAIAPAAAAAGNVSVRSAREMAGEFASTGKIGLAMYTGLIGTVKDYAATTGQQVPDATKALADAFADPARGADALDRQLAILNDTTRENIQRLAMQGDRLGAQKALLDAYKNGLTSATELTSAWGRTTAAVGATISDIWDKVGGAVDRVVTGGDLETRLATARKVLENSRARTGGIFGTLLPGVAGSDVNTAQDEVNRLQAEIQKRDQRLQQAQQNQISTRLGDIVRSLDPAGEQLKKLSDQAKDIATNLSRLPFDEQGNARRAMDGLLTQAKQLRMDMAAGGSEYAAALRAAQFSSRTSGFTPTGLSAAQINQSAAEKEITARTQPGSQDQINARLQSIETERVTLLQNLERSATLEGNQIGGAFSRMSAAVQQQILAAAQDPRYGRIPANIVAAIAEHESSGNLNIGQTKLRGEDGRPATAYGLGQINAPTAAAAVRSGYLPPGYDRTDPNTAAIGIAGVLSMKMGPNGTIEDAIKRYRGSTSDSVNSAYLADIMRRAGQMGDPSTGAQARDQDAYTRVLRDQQQQLQNVAQNYGKNGLALDAASEAARRYNTLLDAGVQPSEALAASIKGLATQTATAAQQIKLTQFAADTGFEREQLGRDRYDQTAFARARSTVGDTTSPAALAVIDQSRQNQYLTDARSTLTDAATGFATALSHGTNAASAFSSALSRIGDKLIGGVLDSLVGSAFKSGGLGSLFGFSEGGYTGPGGRLQPAGLVHAGEVVFSQADVARWGGPHVVDRMRRGFTGYADGGLVPMPQLAAPVPPVPVANVNAPAADARPGDTWNLDLRGSSLTEGQVRGAIVQAIQTNNSARDRTLIQRQAVAMRRFG